MTWPTAPLASIAPRQTTKHHLPTVQNLWHPKPSHIESKTGRILHKVYESYDNSPNNYFLFNDGDVLLSKFRPESSKVIIADEEGIDDNQWIALQPNTQVIDPQFLAYYLRSPLFRHQALRHTVGLKAPRISESWLNGHCIPLPPLVEQRHIVMILDKTIRLLQLQDTAKHKSQAVLRAQYVNMFGGPASNPMQLQKARLGDLVEWRVGKSLDESDLHSQGRYAVYGTGANLRRTDQWLCEANTIILTRTGPHCGDVRYTQEKAWITSQAIFVSKKHVELEERYLLTALVLAELGNIGGSAKPVLSIRQLQTTEILLPDQSQQQKFAHFAEKIELIWQLQTAGGKQLGYLWEKLQEQAFSGQLKAKALLAEPIA